MTPSMWLQNLAAYSLQVAALVFSGTLLLLVFRIRSPRARLVCWQGLLAACLLLPLLQRWERPAVSSGVEISQGAANLAAPAAGSSTQIPFQQIALGLLAAGAAFRVLWLALGFWRLRRYRMLSQPLEPLPPAVREVAMRLRVFPDVRISAEIAAPVTFGFRLPVVLLPPGFLGLAPSVQQAVACHEFLHVRRRDWLFTLFEEFIRAALWFHPAVWWLLGNIQLTREQAVDRAVVAFTRSRDQYVEALIAIASAKPRLDLAPAPLFLRRRHLTQRVACLLKEVSMSKRRLISSLVSVCSLLLLVGWAAVSQFPLRGMPQEDGVKVDQGSLRLLHRAPVQYPREAKQKRIEGAVILELDINQEGNVSDARVLSGPQELRKAALESVLQWHYAKDPALPARVQASVSFRLEPGDKVVAELKQPPVSIPSTPTRILKQIDLKSLPEALRDALQSRLARFEGQAISSQLMEEVRSEVLSADEHLILQWNRDGLRVALKDSPVQQTIEQKVRVGGNVQAAKLINQVRPVYPPEAKQAGIEGQVRMTALIGKDGTVQNLTADSGPPLLVPAAMEAVRQWVYELTYLNGAPVEVVTQIDVNFTLSK